MGMTEPLVGNAEAAAYVGVSESTWRGYVTRTAALKPVRREVRGAVAHPVWERATIDAWQATRRGQGWRRSGNEA